jgi:DNA-binding NtrC family response regulator
MQEVRKRIAVCSHSRSPVLIHGETGTGKELVARIIHYSGLRKDHPLVPVRCRALSGGSLEFEIFGEVRKAARRIAGPKRGALEEASGGTMYLEEVGELGLPVQERLLYVLEEHHLRLSGGGPSVPVDTRFIASSTRSLGELVRKGRFRQDLLSLLRIIEITLPPLRDRTSDIAELAEHFLRRHENPSANRHVLSPEALLMLHGHGWPGNIAEFECALESAMELNQTGVLKPEDFPSDVQADFRRGVRPEVFFTTLPSLSNLRKRYISYVLQMTGGNKSDAAAILGVSRKTLYSMVSCAKPGAAEARKTRKT